MLHEYHAHRQKIADQFQIVANQQIINNSWRDPPCIIFDFRNGVVKISLHPFRAVCPSVNDNVTRRVINAGYHLLVMRFVDGKGDHMLVYPALSAS
jgi:hypothetical protein